MDTPLPKRRQILRSLAGTGGISHSALARVLEVVSKSEFLQQSDPASKWTICRAVVDSLLRDIGTDEHVLALRPTLDGHPPNTFVWRTVSPQRSLAYFVQESEMFRRVLNQLWDRCKTTWNLVLYTDEISPGAILKPIIKKKSHVWYITILELGRLLGRTDFWIPIAMLRSSKVKQLPGGLSAATRILLRSMCLGPDALSNAGLCFRNNDGADVIAHIRLGRILADEDALSSLWGIKGASGTVPCGIKCTVVNKPRGKRHLASHDPSIVDIGCHNVREIILNTDEDVWSKVDMLKASCIGDKADPIMEQGFGITFCPYGILADVELRSVVSPTKSNRFDAMHVLYSNGIVPLEISLFVRWLQDAHNLGYEDIGLCAKSFRFPRRLDSPIHVFSTERIKKHASTFKAGASEVLSIYPLVRHFLETQRLPQSVQVDSIMQLFLVLDVIKQVQCLASEDAPPEAEVDMLVAKLTEANRNYLIAFKLAYGIESIIPKHHMLMHLPEQILADKLLIWCFAPERLNFTLKGCVEDTDNTKRMETIGLAKALNAQLHALSKYSGDFLNVPLAEFPELSEAFGMKAHFSKAATFKSSKIHVGDICILCGLPDKY
jgi:hypothetical protein